MAPTRRLVRRQPLKDRLLAMLNPMDFLLWLSEEIETREWDSKALGTRSGVVASVIFLLARANTGGSSQDVDDVFGDDEGTGWVPFIVRHPQAVLAGARSELTSLFSRRILPYGRLWVYHLPTPSTPSRECATTDYSKPISSECRRRRRQEGSRCSRNRRLLHPYDSWPTSCRQRRRSREHMRTGKTTSGSSRFGIRCQHASGSSVSSAPAMSSFICFSCPSQPSNNARA